MSSKYYQPTGLALDIFKSRYAIHEQETWTEACIRTATHVASAEQGENIPKYRDLFRDMLESNLFMPGGRIMYGSGRPKSQLMNCFVAPTSDSREGWGRTVSDQIIIGGTGGGLGLNFSTIRPRGSKIQGTGGYATGAVSLMEIVNTAGGVIRAGGGRRSALMFALNINHGDIQEFLDKKLDGSVLTNANVSVILNESPEDFFRRVREGSDIELKHNGKCVGTANAASLWKRIVENSLKCGEPGILNGYLANKMSNTYYTAPLIGTNPCGEQFLPAYGSCCLGSLVLPRFVNGQNRSVDWDLLRETVRLAVRFLDDVISVNYFPLSEIREVCTSERRIGLGVMGLHDLLLLLGHRYSSPEGLEAVNKIQAFIKNEAYIASTELATEKGSFPQFDTDLFLKSGFIKTLKPTIRALVRERGIRNCALLTVAPTGTTSMVSNSTSGIEPLFSAAYFRRFRDGDDWRQEVVLHPLFKKFLDEGRDVSHFEGASDLSLRDHLEMQRTVQKHVDAAVSKTINVKPGVSADDLSELLMEFIPEIKGVTVYADGSRENQPLVPIPLEDAVLLANGQISLEAYAKTTCRSGTCDI